MAIVVFTLAVASLILSVKYFFSISKMYKDIREKYIEKEEELRKEAEIH
jgi:Tfp pilus assembly protein PilO